MTKPKIINRRHDILFFYVSIANIYFLNNSSFFLSNISLSFSDSMLISNFLSFSLSLLPITYFYHDLNNFLPILCYFLLIFNSVMPYPISTIFSNLFPKDVNRSFILSFIKNFLENSFSFWQDRNETTRRNVFVLISFVIKTLN